jgi:hypothetical protein
VVPSVEILKEFYEYSIALGTLLEMKKKKSNSFIVTALRSLKLKL